MSSVSELLTYPLVDTIALLNAIPSALEPDLDDATGIACIRRVFQEVNLGEMVRTPFVDTKKIVALEPLLPSLPPLHGRMTTEEFDEFLAAYRRLPNRLAWEPGYIEQHDRNDSQWKRGQLKEQLRGVFNEAIARGELIAVDEHHVPQKAVLINVYFLRDSIVTYLDSIKLLDKLGIKSQVLVPSTSDSSASHDSVYLSSQVISSSKARPDAIARVIVATIKECSEFLNLEIQEIEASDVWPFLKEKALNAQHPFTGTVINKDEKGEGPLLEYTDANGAPRMFKKKHLIDRIGRSKKK